MHRTHHRQTHVFAGLAPEAYARWQKRRRLSLFPLSAPSSRSMCDVTNNVTEDS